MQQIAETVRMSSDLKNYYEVLEIHSTARSEEVYHSYLRAKSAYSSDSLALYSLMSQEECRNVLELVEEAYSILSDPMKRKRYDEARGFNREINALNYSNLSERSTQVRAETSFAAAAKPIGAPVSAMLREEFKLNSQSSAPISSGEMSPRAAQTLSNTTNVTRLVTQKHFALDFEANAEFDKEIEDATEFTGDFLRKIREYKSVDLERLSDMTKVSRLYLQGIESEDYDKLPAPVYVRGFVFQYAKCLKLRPEIVANSYVARMKKLKP
jgi:hypothetical protein